MGQGARTYRELVVWQFADALKAEIYWLAAIDRVARDFRFRDQLMASAGSVTANIVEGFARRSPRDFARFLRIAYASAMEVENWLDDGVARGHWRPDQIRQARRLGGRLRRALRSFIRYLQQYQRQPG